MQITSLRIQNFKYIQDLLISDIENALILVGKNNTGKTGILDAVRTVFGGYQVTEKDLNEKKQNIEISMTLRITDEDLLCLHAQRKVSTYKRFEAWKRDFCKKLPSFQDGELFFTCSVNRSGEVRYFDGYQRHNRYMEALFPRLYCIDTGRDVKPFQEDLLMFQEDEQLIRIRSGACMFDGAKQCNHCYSCVGLIDQKRPEELTLHETVRLLEYKMYQLNLSSLSQRVNEKYQKNGGREEIRYTLSCDLDHLFDAEARAWHEQQQRLSPVEHLGNGMKSIYMLSLLETYIEEEKRIPSIILVEYPELFLHPSLQKTAGEILHRLSKKNQVIFSTHSPAMISNFSGRQLHQVVLDEGGYSTIRDDADIDQILDDLGYSANDVLNVDFVFIVEGKQDKSRLPLLLEKYYSELYAADGSLSRVSIITTNSCTNIRTYANLKYMNQVYLRDQFLMIRDSDGKDPEQLAGYLCRYYHDRGREDADKLPKVQRRNVLILKYYSFENYFLDPKIMVRLGIVRSEKAFWKILFSKWKKYLYRLSCGRNLVRVLGREIDSIETLQAHFEEFKIYMRGHNLYDIFYGRFKDREIELLKQYIDLAPRETFQDILDAIEAFPFFDSRKRQES